MNSCLDRNETKYIGLSIILITLMCIIGNSANPFLTMIIIGVCILFINRPEYLLPAVLISSLLGDYFVAFLGIGMSRVTVLIYILFSVIHLLIERKCVSKTKLLVLFFAILYCFFSAATSLTGLTKPAITMALNLVLVFFMAHQSINNREVFIKNLQYSIWVFCIYIVYAFVTGRGIYYFANRLIITGTNSNAFGMCMAVIVVFLLSLSYTRTTKTGTFLNVCYAIISFFILCLTGSRSALIASVVGFCFMVLFVNSTGKIKTRIITIALFSISLFIAYKLLEVYAPEIILRFTIESVEENGGTGRADIWKAVIQNVIPYHMLFGVGLGGENTIQAMAPYVANALGVHNMYISILMQTGIVGSAVFYFFWSKCFRDMYLYRKLDQFIYTPMLMGVSLFVNGIGEEVYGERFLWFVAGLVYLIIYNANENGAFEDEEEDLICS